MNAFGSQFSTKGIQSLRIKNIKMIEHPPVCLGGVPADVPGSLWRTAEDLHGAGGSQLRQGDAGQPAHHRPC